MRSLPCQPGGKPQQITIAGKGSTAIWPGVQHWHSPGLPLHVSPDRGACKFAHASNLKPAKEMSTERIDGIAAIIMASGRALVAQEEPQPQYQVLVF
jgi:hypothetical protein